MVSLFFKTFIKDSSTTTTKIIKSKATIIQQEATDKRSNRTRLVRGSAKVYSTASNPHRKKGFHQAVLGIKPGLLEVAPKFVSLVMFQEFALDVGGSCDFFFSTLKKYQGGCILEILAAPHTYFQKKRIYYFQFILPHSIYIIIAILLLF